jgi:ectoine utilization protein EutC
MARDIYILTETDLRHCVKLGPLTVNVIEEAFRLLAGGQVIMPPILSMQIPEAHGEVDVKTAYLPGLDGFAIKVSPGFFNNPKLGLASLSGLMIVLSAKTGLVEAVLLDNGYLTDVRTAAAGAVAARHLAPEIVETAGVLGTGAQARLQIEAAYLERKFRRVMVWGRKHEHSEACARDITAKLNVKAEAIADAGRVLRESQLVVTATAASEPIVKAEWLHPGLHITAMGSDQAEKNEIEPSALEQADLYVSDRVSQCEKLGELRAAHAAGLMNGKTPPELGEIIAGEKAGRRLQSDITICDLTGTGAQDTAIAIHALQAARTEGKGSVIKT